MQLMHPLSEQKNTNFRKKNFESKIKDWLTKQTIRLKTFFWNDRKFSGSKKRSQTYHWFETEPREYLYHMIVIRHVTWFHPGLFSEYLLAKNRGQSISRLIINSLHLVPFISVTPKNWPKPNSRIFKIQKSQLMIKSILWINVFLKLV